MAPKKIVQLNTVPEFIRPAKEPLEDVEEEEIEPTLGETVPDLVDDGEDEDDGEDDEDDEDDDSEGGEYEEYEQPPDLFEILSGLMVTREGETIADVLAGINENLDKHNKIMYKMFKILESKK
jgi:hypothetical protein